MLTFKYSAISLDGAKVSGIVEAIDRYDAVAKIKENCSRVTGITEVRSGKREQTVLFQGKVKEKSLAVMCSQFSIILSAGLPIVRAVELIAGQTSDKQLKKILLSVAKDVGAGFSLAKSFADEGEGQLPLTFIETVRSGEQSGTLDQSFRRLHSYYDKSYKMKGKVKGAMVYPAFTLVVAAIVVVIIMVKAVPAFTNSFASSGAKMPGVTLALMAISAFFTRYWLLLTAAIAALLLCYKLYAKQGSGRLKTARLKLRMPVFGKLNTMKGASQFANTMCTLLSAGLSVVDAVSITGKVMDNFYLSTQVLEVVPQLEEGRQLGASLRQCPYLPDMLVEMTGVGEETGSLESTLEVVGVYYDNETEMASARMMALLEPVIICVLAVVVCFLLLSVYLPMFSLYDSM